MLKIIIQLAVTSLIDVGNYINRCDLGNKMMIFQKNNVEKTVQDSKVNNFAV